MVAAEAPAKACSLIRTPVNSAVMMADAALALAAAIDPVVKVGVAVVAAAAIAVVVTVIVAGGVAILARARTIVALLGVA